MYNNDYFCSIFERTFIDLDEKEALFMLYWLPDEYPTFSTVAGMIIIVSSLVIYFKGAEISKCFNKIRI